MAWLGDATSCKVFGKKQTHASGSDVLGLAENHLNN